MRVRRSSALFLSAVLTATLVQGVAPPVALAAGGPSVPLPAVPSESVTKQGNSSPDTGDETSPGLDGNQGARTVKPGASNYAATSLSPSATWEVSGQTGDFSWTYPLPVPPAPGGLAPNLTLSYSSGAVDGLTSTTNNQASWIGDGWSLWPGFVERRYRGCADDLDGEGDEPADLCWHTDNAVLSLGGSGSELIRDAASPTEVWKPKSDDGSRIERVPAPGNGDDNNESWKITTVDGTQYFFGSAPDAKSTWTVPVYGDDANEPCHQTTGFADSWCNQGYRWNLDKVVDRHGNMIRYYYETETNHYGRNKNSAATSYVRNGWLHHVDYGLHASDANIAPSGKVEFAVADRCVKNSDCILSTPENLPDVPLELKCDGGSCGDEWSPSFWTTKQLTTVTTKSLVNGEYKAVDSWALRHELPDPGTGEKPALWLKGITHTGHTGDTPVALPEVTFDGVRKENRVYGVDGYSHLVRFRMNAIVSESGGVTSIDYATPDCVFGSSMPADAHTNDKRCFPVRWTPVAAPERTDYFHKYVVSQVSNYDGVAGTLAAETAYEYLDGAAWHWDTSEFVNEEKKNWTEFRGFSRVRIRTGSGEDGPRTMTEQRFYRGMYGDKLTPAGGVRTTQVTDSQGVARDDVNWLSGFQFESATFEQEAPSDQPDPKRIVKTITDPFVSGPTASRDGRQAHIVRPEVSQVYTAVGASGVRVTRAKTTYETTWGLPIAQDDLGDISTDADDLCTTTTYRPNNGSWLIAFPSRVETVSLRCGQTPQFPADAVSDTLTYYDGQTSDLPPTTGNATEVHVAADRPAAAPVYVLTAKATFDQRGRVRTTTDALGNVSTTDYSPAVAGPVTQAVTTTPGPTAGVAGFATTTTFDPLRGKPKKVNDPNDSLTEFAYDAFGRSAEVWLPNRPRTTYADGNFKFSYLVRNNAPTVVTTKRLGPSGTSYVTTNQLLDGMLRLRQKQAPAPGGGRLLTNTRYDSHGRAVGTTRPYYNSGAVDTDLWLPTDNVVPGMTVVEYDGAGRPKKEAFLGNGVEEWHTAIAYGGDRVTVTPPEGGTTTTSITDARGRMVEFRQHGPNGDDITAYEHTPTGELAQVTDPGGNVWTYTYDLRGRKVTETDPDRGQTTHTYDDADHLVSTTDARGAKLFYDYDNLGRKTVLRKDSMTGDRLADWTYDSVPYSKGLPASSTRYVGSAAYKTSVLAYTALYQPAKIEVEIPAVEGTELDGKYSSTLTYKADGSLASETYPAAGGLLPEGVSHSYSELGLPQGTWGGYNSATVDYVFASDYTRYGELQRLEFGKGTKRAWLSRYFQDESRRLERTVVDAEVSNPMQADFHYTYDDVGNITSVADIPTGLPTDVQCFRYDHLSRLTEAWTAATTAWTQENGCTSQPSTNTLAGASPYWHSYGYDLTGNRVQEIQHAATGDTTSAYTYQGHRLDTATTTAGGVTTLDEYDYDAVGNTTSRVLTGEGETLEWDTEGHLVKVTKGSAETTFVYTADGQRLIRRDPQAVTLYLGNQEIRLDRVSKVTTGTRYYTHGGQTVAVRTQAALNWLATDHQGTGAVSINSTTQQVSRRRHLPFGEPRATTPSVWPGERGFVGGTIDASTGLTHLGAREYDPTLGRFISVDPIMDTSDPQQMNGYTYSNNSPVTFSDPSGLKIFVDNDHWVDSGGCRDGSCGENFPAQPGGGVVGGGSGGDDDNNPVTTTTGSAPPPATTSRPAPEVDMTPPPTGVSNDQAENYSEWLEITSRPSSGGCIAEMAAFCFTYWLFLEDPVECGVNQDVGACVGVGLSALGPLGKVLSFLRKIPFPSKADEAGDVASGAGKAPSCKPSSFEPGTLVLLADGTSKPIEDVEVGDEVLATDSATGETTPRTVVATITTKGQKDLVKLTVDTDGQAGDRTGTVVATAAHPFWVTEKGRWLHAGNLRPGDELRTDDGTPVEVRAATVHTEYRRVHNLTVAGVHTYYVLATDTPVLVHNRGGCDGDLGPDWEPRPVEEICGSFGCEAVARDIQNRIGGDIFRISAPPGITMGKYRGVDTLWAHHEVVVRDGRVYDAFTDRKGLPVEEYKALWKDMFPEEFPF